MSEDLKTTKMDPDENQVLEPGEEIRLEPIAGDEPVIVYVVLKSVDFTAIIDSLGLPTDGDLMRGENLNTLFRYLVETGYVERVHQLH